MQTSAKEKHWLVVIYVILISWIHGSSYTSLQSDVARALCSVAAAWCSSCAGCSCAEDNSMSSPRSPLCSTAALQSTHRHHSLQESCSTATAAWPELPAEKKLSFLQKNKNANLAQASSRVQNMCAKYEAADKSRRRRRVLGPEWG